MDSNASGHKENFLANDGPASSSITNKMDNADNSTDHARKSMALALSATGESVNGTMQQLPESWAMSSNGMTLPSLDSSVTSLPRFSSFHPISYAYSNINSNDVNDYTMVIGGEIDLNYTKLLQSFTVYGSTFLMHPISGIAIGYMSTNTNECKLWF